MEEVEKLAWRYALANALAHGGKAREGPVLGRVLAERPDLRARVGELRGIVERVVREVNELPPEVQKAKLEELGPPEVRRGERKGLPELPKARRGEVVTRFAPNPNGPLHLGHVRAALLSYEYARRYGGKFILRFEDTNPQNARLDMYELIRTDLRWLGIDWQEEYYQSDRLELYYRYAERLIREGRAYVCTCPPAEFKRRRDAGEACPCRELGPAEHLRRWEAMLGGELGEGKAVVRIKTELSHPNPAVRDWPALRVVTSPHPRKGSAYRVWPLYNFSVSIDDHEMGITHIFRGKEHEVNQQCQEYLYRHLGWEYPVSIQFGRLEIEGAELSKSRIIEGIERGEYSGPDDVRLATLASLRRRGIQPEAIRQTLLEVGLTLVDSRLSWETLYANNRKLLDPVANRYFFVPDPMELEIHGVPEVREVEIRKHPNFPERGKRKIEVKWEDNKVRVWISGKDKGLLEEGSEFRLIGFVNVKIKEGRPRFAGFEVLRVPKIQWVSEGLPCTLLTPEGEVKGLAEKELLKEDIGSVVQFERVGFARLEGRQPLTAVYAHP